MRARGEEAVLVRVAVDRVVEEVGPDPAVVEERVPLARRPVADDLLALAPKPNQEVEKRAFRLLDVLGEAHVALRRAETCLLLAREQLGYGPGRLVRAARLLRIDAKRAAVRPQLLDVVDLEPVGAQDLGGRPEREVREMLVVDRVVLKPVEQTEQVRKLEGRGPVVAQQRLTPATKSFRSGTCARTLLPTIRLARLPSSTELCAVSRPKKSTSVGTPRSSAASATLAAGSIPRIGMPVPTKCWSR